MTLRLRALFSSLLAAAFLAACAATPTGPASPVTQAPSTWETTLAQTPPPALASELPAAWQTARLVRVEGEQLPLAIDALMAWHVDGGFFGDFFDGMQRLRGFGPGKDVEVQLTPQRRKVRESKDKTAASCPFCKPPFDSERGLGWRDYVIWPNAFPYVPASYQHILLTTARHIEQSFWPELLGDVLDFQRAASGGKLLTMHYNGIAGNSQPHLHWQAMREVLPLQRALDEGRLTQRPLLEDASGSVSAYESGVYFGFLVSGDRAFIVRWGGKIVKQLETEPLTRGAYNLLLLNPTAEGQQRLAVIPRRADNLKPAIGSLGTRGLGAFNMGGIMVLTQPDVPADFDASFPQAVQATVVPPSELPWSKELSAL